MPTKVAAALIPVFLSTSGTAGAIDQARELLTKGVQQFKRGEVTESIASFDQAMTIDPKLTPYLWQRGLALYLDDRYDACANQFATDVAVNPADTEEAVWNSICIAQKEQKMMPDLIKLSSGDRRPVMQYVYDLYRGKINAQELVDFGKKGNGGSTFFYSRLYLSLYYHSQMHEDKTATVYIDEAMKSSYAQKAKDQDLMVTVGEMLQKKLLSQNQNQDKNEIRTLELMRQAKRLNINQKTYAKNELNAIDAIKALEAKTQQKSSSTSTR